MSIVRLLVLALSLCLIAGMPLPRPVQADPRIVAHEPLAKSMARKFISRMGGMLDMGDLFAIAMTQVWKASIAFDPAYGVTFGQYAQSRIWAEFQRQQRLIWTEGRRVWLRQSSIHPQDEDDLGIELVSGTPSPLALVSGREELLRVREAVASLPPRQRRAVEECFFEDRSMAEAGDMVGVTKQAIEQQQRAAFRSLSKKLLALREEER